MTAAMKRWRYLRRLLHYQQMDFEFAFWQMVYLISNPKVVYKNCKKIILHYKNCLSLNFALLNLLTTCVKEKLDCTNFVHFQFENLFSFLFFSHIPQKDQGSICPGWPSISCTPSWMARCVLVSLLIFYSYNYTKRPDWKVWTSKMKVFYPLSVSNLLP